jgi:anti-sigma B factor antagonist
MSEPQAIAIQPHAQVVWAVIQQRELNDTAIDQMQRQVSAAAAQQPSQPVVLDMSQVEFVPSLALGALVSLMRRLKQEGHRFILVGMHPDVRTTLAVTRLDKLFEIHPNLAEALNHLA